MYRNFICCRFISRTHRIVHASDRLHSVKQQRQNGENSKTSLLRFGYNQSDSQHSLSLSFTFSLTLFLSLSFALCSPSMYFNFSFSTIYIYTCICTIRKRKTCVCARPGCLAAAFSFRPIWNQFGTTSTTPLRLATKIM